MRGSTAFISAFLLVISSVVHSAAGDEYAEVRRRMLERDIRGRGIKDVRVLGAMAKIKRHLFVPRGQHGRAYGDHPLPIGEGQTISQPYVVALMTEALVLKPTDRVFEVGTGSGYQAAVLGELAKEVYTVEIRPRLAERAGKLLKELGYENVSVKHGDGYFGWPEHAPFDAVIITAAANHISPHLIRQLKEGGRIIVPLGSTLYYQVLTLGKKKGGELELTQMGSVRFVPMVGEVQKTKGSRPPNPPNHPRPPQPHP